MNTPEVRQNKLTIIAHIGTSTLPDTIDLAKHAVELKVYAVALMAPK